MGLRSPLLLGIDVGTSSCKAAVVDAASGAELVHGSAVTPWIRVASAMPPSNVRPGIVRASAKATPSKVLWLSFSTITR